MLLFRIDNRLIHGQIIEAWLPYTQAKHLIVANDSLADDDLRQQIFCLAIPAQIQVYFIHIQQLAKTITDLNDQKIFVILENCSDAKFATSQDIPKPHINIGNLHFAAGKKQLLPHVAVTEEELDILKHFDANFSLDFRAVPTEKSRGLHEL